jgi:hypothetical protein
MRGAEGRYSPMSRPLSGRASAAETAVPRSLTLGSAVGLASPSVTGPERVAR